MRIRLDDVDLALDDDILNEGKEAIYNAAKKIALQGSSVIADIIVDGESIQDDVAFFSLSGGLDVRFVTQPIRQLVPESLKEGERYLSLLETGLDGIATLFEQGKDQEALSRFANCVDGIDWLMNVFGKCCLLLGIPQDSFKAGNYGEYVESFNKLQREILSSIEGGKNLRVAFLVRDELIPSIDSFSKFWNEVKEQAETPLQ
jgi:hypothetical protein